MEITFAPRSDNTWFVWVVHIVMYGIVLNDFIYTGTSLNGIRPPLIMWIQFIGITVWEEM